MRTRHARHGFLLVATLLVIAGLAILTTVSMTRSSTDLLMTNRFVVEQQAFYLAEAGVDCAIAQLRHTTTLGAACNAGDRIVTASSAGGDVYTITSTAASVRTITASVRRAGGSPFQHAVYGTGTWVQCISFSQAMVDSYDSRLGAYDQNLTTQDPAYGWDNKSQNGLPTSWNADIRTNSTVNLSGAMKAIAIFGAASRIMGKGKLPVMPPENGVYGSAAIQNGLSYEAVYDFPQVTFPTLPSDPSMCVLLPVTITTDFSADPLYTTNSCFYATDVTIGPGGKLSLPQLNTLQVTGMINVESGGVLEVGQGSSHAATIRSTYVQVRTGGAVRVTKNAGPVSIYAEQLRVTDPGTVVKAYDTDPSPTREVIQPDTLRVYIKRETLPFGYYYGRILNGAEYHGTIYTKDAQIQLGDRDPPFYAGSPPVTGRAPATLYGAIITTRPYITGGSGVSALHYDEAVKAAQDWPDWMAATVTLLAQY